MRLIQLLKKELAKEARGWVDESLITHEQGQAILAKYGESLDNDANKTSFGYYLLMALGSLFIGLALILIISHNWDEIPSLVKTGALILLTLTTNLIGLRLYLTNRHQAANIWVFFGAISYGTSIMLIAQIYHLGEHYPDGIYWWALGVLPLVLLTRSRLLSLLMLALGTIWLCVEVGEAFFPASYPVFVLSALFLALYCRSTPIIFVFSLFALLVWLNLALAWLMGSGMNYEPFGDLLPFSLALGLVFNGLAWALMRTSNPTWREYGLVLHLWLLRVSVVTLLILSFEGVWHEYSSESDMTLVLSIAALIMCGVVSWRLSAKNGRYASMPAVLYSICFSICFIAQAYLSSGDMIAAVTINFLLLVLGISLIRRGIEQDETQYFYTGVGVLLATAFVRYFDLIGDYLGGALLFLIAASIMMLAARYWRLRGQTKPGGRADEA
ncbi:DUF2157 domain-containing protein [Shewanella violacea]|uniref:DUF2157 domain-containing protein n=1 Tax=Shewanella violacea (strain JCM 10179 / CIP 106290 / LMG 19151 / DSS12) TaxID=637905 RepID=D4ZJZ1_SHEVD|nr:DUF2157 domain-containing protein [Shewanella violacea]BAJ01990.1 hypothetical protein SVI_2019 [Shewanella violacea DSS12]